MRILRGSMAVLIVVLALGGCSSSQEPAPNLGLANAKAGLASEAVPGVPMNTPYLMNEVSSVCVADAPVTITRASTVDAAGGMKVLDWGVGVPTPGAAPVADGPGTFASLRPAGIRHQQVASKCAGNGDSGLLVDLDIELTKPVATSHGFNLAYREHGETRQLFLPFLATFCTGKACPAKYSSGGLAIIHGELVDLTPDGQPIK